MRGCCWLRPCLYAETAATDPLEEQQRLEDELRERREAAQFTVLAKDTVLAGIHMPKGTRLRLPGYTSTGTDEWTQPPYFIRADFPQAVTWQGVRVKSLERGVFTPEEQHSVFAIDGTAPEKPLTEPVWSSPVYGEAVSPAVVSGIHCGAGDIMWRRAGEVDDLAANVPAAGPLPQPYVLDICVSAGQDFATQNGVIRMRLPENSAIFRSAFATPQGDVYYWSTNGHTRLSFNLFELDEAVFYANLNDASLHRFSGRILAGSSSCALPPGTVIEWRDRQPDVLWVEQATADMACGGLEIRKLGEMPWQMQLKLPEIIMN